MDLVAPDIERNQKMTLFLGNRITWTCMFTRGEETITRMGGAYRKAGITALSVRDICSKIPDVFSDTPPPTPLPPSIAFLVTMNLPK